MLIIKDKANEQVYEVTDTTNGINVDVVDLSGNVDYTFFIDKEEMLEILEAYQKERNIYG